MPKWPQLLTLLALAVPLALASLAMWFARKAADATVETIPDWPGALLHTWVAGVAAISGLYFLFCLPWLLLGMWGPGLAGAAFSSAVVLVLGRDILKAIRDDLRRHVAEGRGWFGHSGSCPAHPHRHFKKLS